MAQHDYVIENDDAADVRSDLNDVLSAIVSLNSGNDAPSVTYATMLWYETDAAILHMRDIANTGWIDLARFDVQNSRWIPLANAIRAASTSEFQLLDNAGAKIIGIAKGGGSV